MIDRLINWILFGEFKRTPPKPLPGTEQLNEFIYGGMLPEVQVQPHTYKPLPDDRRRS